MKRVIIESPYAAANGHTVADHEEYARRCMADSLARGEAPFASHLLYPQPGILDDSDAEQRRLGMKAGHAWLSLADYLVAYVDLGISVGMDERMNLAHKIGAQVVTRHIGRGGG